jgi:uncharacterized protein
MIIDTHVHIGRNDLLTASVDDLLKSMDKAGIDKAFVFAAEMFDAPNEWMLEQIKPHTDRLYGVAQMPRPEYPDGYSLRPLIDWHGEGKIVAVKAYTGYQHLYPTEYYGLYELGQAECPIIFHSGDCYCKIKHAKLKYAHPLHIDEVAVDFPNLNIIIAHMGYPWVKDAAEVCYKNPKCFADISGFVYGEFDAATKPKFIKAIEEFIEIADQSKLLFGSDWPISDQSSYVEMMGSSVVHDRLTKNAKFAFKLDEI